ncbi:hypothetical protein AAHC03_016452 [Spirometra sp. Aus1]
MPHMTPLFFPISSLEESHDPPGRSSPSADALWVDARNIPTEVWLNIFAFLPTNVKLTVIARVCRQWYLLTRSACLWRNVDLGWRIQLPVLRRLISYGILGEHVVSVSLTGTLFASLDVALLRICQTCPNLHCLRVDRGRLDSLHTWMAHLPAALTHLKPPNSAKLAAAADTGGGFRCLRRLTLSGCSWLSDDLLFSGLLLDRPGARQLVELHVAGCYRLARGPPLFRLSPTQRARCLADCLFALTPQLEVLDVSGVFGGVGGDHDGSGPSASDILTAALPCLKTILI